MSRLGIITAAALALAGTGPMATAATASTEVDQRNREKTGNPFFFGQPFAS